jgi:GTP-binding protein
MIERYLQKSKQLKLVFLLIDIRHEPSANDKNMYEWIEYNGFEPVIIATKLDKINRSQVQKHMKMLRTGLGLKKETILIPFSSETKQGKEEVWNIIDSYLKAGQDVEAE